MHPQFTSLGEKLETYADRSGGPDACWTWLKSRISTGYGAVWTGERVVLAHRLAWEIENGPIPKGMVICHACDNRLCVNPSHLFIGSHADNVRDKVSKGRGRNGVTLGTMNRRSKTNESQVQEIRRLYAGGTDVNEIASLFGMTRQNIGFIVRRDTWKHVP